MGLPFASPSVVTSKKSRTPEPEPETAAAVTSVAPPSNFEHVDFEQALAELEAIVEQLEQGELPLQESLKQFERGVQLTRTCHTALKRAEQQVEILLRKTGTDQEFEAAPFRSEGGD